MQDLFDDELLDGPQPEPRRPPRPPRKRRRGRRSGETAKRILFAIPWIIVTIAITVAGGIVFSLAMIAVSVAILPVKFGRGRRVA